VINRYLAEFKSGDEKKDAAENTMVAYKVAQVHHFIFI
jgi:14-3-3 protein epsilon